MKLLIGMIFFITLLKPGIICESDSVLENQGVSAVEPFVSKPTITVELAIFCDTATVNMFHGDDQRMNSYWHQLVWNVDLRYKTLDTVNIKFRVNSIIKLKSRDEVELKKNVPSNDAKYSAAPILANFGRWLYAKSLKENMTNFDIAILAVRDRFLNNVVGMAEEGKACAMDIYNLRVVSIAIITTWHNEVQVSLTHEIGHLLGAPHDQEGHAYWSHNCDEKLVSEKTYIMGKGKFFFSPCSKKSILNFIQSDKANCLRHASTNEEPIIDTSSHCVEDAIANRLSLTEQCQILVDYTAAFANLTGDQCREVNCQINSGNGSFVGNTTFNPLDYTKCTIAGLQGHCKLGHCMHQGRERIVNVATGKCLGLEYSFSGNSGPPPIFYNCSTKNPSIDFVRLENSSTKGFLLFSNLVPISPVPSNTSHTEQSLGELCLSFDTRNYGWDFPKWDTDSEKNIWELYSTKQIQPDADESFCLYHIAADMCLKARNDFQGVYFTKQCSLEDKQQLWRFEAKEEVENNNQCEKA